MLDRYLRCAILSHCRPQYYAEACKKAILASSGLPSGTLELKCAASADVGSSQVMFAHLARVVITAVRDRLNGDAIIDLAFKYYLGEACAILKGETGGRRA